MLRFREDQSLIILNIFNGGQTNVIMWSTRRDNESSSFVVFFCVLTLGSAIHYQDSARKGVYQAEI